MFLLLRKTVRFFQILLGVFILASITVYFTHSDHDFVYYSIVTRFWQLALGCLGWLWVKDLPKKNFKWPLNITLIALVLVFLLPLQMQEFVRPLISFLTISLLILIVRNDKTRTVILENEYLNYIGLVSYSLYLWHWPVITFMKATTGPSLFSITFSIIIISVMTYISYEFIEKKFRHVQFRFHRHVQIPLILILIGISSLLTNKLRKFDFFIGVETKFSLADKEAWNNSYCYTSRKIPGDKKDYERCKVVTGTDGSRTTIYIYGNSYAKQLLPVFYEVAKEKKYQMNMAAASFCQPLPYTQKEEIGPLTCYGSFQRYLHFSLGKMKEGDILVLSYSPFFLENESNLEDGTSILTKEKKQKMFFNTLLNINEKLKQKGASLLIVGSIPLLKMEPNFCYQPWSQFREDCSNGLVNLKSTQVRKKTDEAIRIFAAENGIAFIDTMKIYDEAAEMKYIYFNQNHLSREGALLSKDHISRMLSQLEKLSAN